MSTKASFSHYNPGKSKFFMTVRNQEEIPENVVLHKGPQGGLYYYRPSGTKVYVSKKNTKEDRKKHKKFEAPRGAFQRYLNATT